MNRTFRENAGALGAWVDALLGLGAGGANGGR
jgi:hypothetical protein